jgi:hypothetical protein
LTQDLAGADVLLPVGLHVLEYWERGLGKGTFEGQTFSLDVLILSKGYVRPSGQNAIQTD